MEAPNREYIKNLWERQPNETSKQYTAFCIYRDAGPERSISEVADKWSNSGATSRLNEWSKKNHWVERATDYDEYIDTIKRFKNEEAIIEMSERHARESQLFQDKAIERLKSLEISELKPQDLIKYYDIAVKIERLSRGVPTENIKREEVKEVNDYVITPEKLKKPEVRDAANKFITTIANSQSSTHGVSTDSK